jgi:uncharacterized membrane protein
MTASKSSRARNARAQAAARSSSAAAGRASRGGIAAAGRASRRGTAVTQPTGAKSATATKTSPAVRTAANGVARTSGPVQAPAVTTPAAPDGLLGKMRAGLASVFSAGESPVPLWLRLTTFLVALVGLGVSIYLTIAHYTESTLAGCNDTGGIVNCTKVTTSAQSYVFGIPVAVLGLAFYVFMVAIMSPWAWRATRREVHLARIAALVAGVGFVLYLLYAELFIIGSICLYCTSVHVLTFILFVLTVFAAATWGIGSRRFSS